MDRRRAPFAFGKPLSQERTADSIDKPLVISALNNRKGSSTDVGRYLAHSGASSTGAGGGGVPFIAATIPR
jgi:hypothetical protein